MECLFASSGSGRRSSAVQRLDHNKFADKPGQAWDAKKQCELLLLDADARVMAAEPDTVQGPEVRFVFDLFYFSLLNRRPRRTAGAGVLTETEPETVRRTNKTRLRQDPGNRQWQAPLLRESSAATKRLGAPDVGDFWSPNPVQLGGSGDPQTSEAFNRGRHL